MGVETGVTTRKRTKAQWVQESGLMDAVCERGNLMFAYQRVVGDKGASVGEEVSGLQPDLAQGPETAGSADWPETAGRQNPRSTQGRTRGERSLTKVIAQLSPILRGWMAYYKLTETERALEELDGWIRRKLRCILWRQG